MSDGLAGDGLQTSPFARSTLKWMSISTQISSLATCVWILFDQMSRDNAVTMADDMNQFGEHLRALRKARDMSQPQLAERAGVNDKYLGEIERGRGNPSLEVLMKLSKALDVELSTLVGDEVVRLGRAGLRAEVNRHADALTDDQLRDLVRMFRLRAP